MYEIAHNSILSKAATDGPQEIDLTGYEGHAKHQITIQVAGVPTAGTLKVEIQQAASTSWMEATGSPVDLTSLDDETAKIYSLEAFVKSFRFTPSADLDVDYSVYVQTVK